MAQDFIIHWQAEIPQIMVGQEASNGQIGILNVIKGHEAIELYERMVNGRYVNKG